MFNGAISALITPFRDGMVDEAALREVGTGDFHPAQHRDLP